MASTVGVRSAALQLRGIRKSFGGVEVLHGVDLNAESGAVTVLLGENGAGKSTLVKIIAGAHQPDHGEILLGGNRHTALDPIRARALGISIVFQELADAPDLTVAENVSLGRLPARRGVVRWKEMRKEAKRVLEDLGVPIDIDARASSLRLGERQVLEIARATAAGGSVLILDEPTAALSAQETDQLFGLIRRLRERGAAIIYITHRLDEVSEIGDRVLVLRDGNIVMDQAVADVGRSDIVSAMIGSRLGEVQRPVAQQNNSSEVVAAFRDASSGDGVFTGVDLSAHAGEVLALYGKIGSGAEEVAEAAYGLHGLAQGEFLVDGKACSLRNPYQAVEAGIGLLPADRQGAGILAGRSVAENICAPSWGILGRFKAFITSKVEATAYRRWHDALGIHSRNDPSQPIGTLSGGNQQKVLLGRWLERKSRLLILIEPTRGVDVGARQEIYRSIRGLAERGTAVIIATSDYEEVVQVADRALVMVRGHVVMSLAGDEITPDRLTYALGA